MYLDIKFDNLMWFLKYLLFTSLLLYIILNFELSFLRTECYWNKYDICPWYPTWRLSKYNLYDIPPPSSLPLPAYIILADLVVTTVLFTRPLVDKFSDQMERK